MSRRRHSTRAYSEHDVTANTSMLSTVGPRTNRQASPIPPKIGTDASAAARDPGPNGVSPRNFDTWISGRMLRTRMLTNHATALPVIPNGGISSRFRITLRTRAMIVFAALHQLLPPISSTTSTGPQAMLTSIASERITRTGPPVVNDAPNTSTSTGAKTAIVR